MCTNRALVDSLECYMDDLVDSFEDFVKKSVIAISLAVGLLIAMIAYALKLITDRTPPSSATAWDTGSKGADELRDGDISRSNTQNYRNRNVLESNFMMLSGQDDKGTCTITAPCADNKIKDEKAPKDTGCSKLNCGLSTPRLSIPSLRSICKKCSTSKISQKTMKVDEKQDSCCSMCCNDKCER